MRVALIGLIFIAKAVSQNVGDLAKAAQSPYDLQRFIDTHAVFSWEPIAKALGSNLEAMPDCKPSGTSTSQCTSELITVLEPFQIIVRLRHDSGIESYLRYVRDSERWRFTGSHTLLTSRFVPEHRLFRFDGRTHLALSGTGYSGSGLSTKLESWFDLARDSFDPVFSYTPEGVETREMVRRDVRAWVFIANEPSEQIRLDLSTTFVVERDRAIKLGARKDTAVLVRGSKGTYYVDPVHSTASVEVIHAVYDTFDNWSKLRGLIPCSPRVLRQPVPKFQGPAMSQSAASICALK